MVAEDEGQGEANGKMTQELYLDNAATSHPKPESVYQAVELMLRQGGSAGRGSHQQSMAADRLLLATRERLAELFHAPHAERFVLTFNATLAINQALFGVLRPGDRVVTTGIEHNAVTRPLFALHRQGVEVIKVPGDAATGLVSPEALKTACRRAPTRLLLVNHCSNVSGALQPVAGLGAWCREQGLLFMLDGSQSAGSLPVDFRQLEVDLFAAPGHKGLLGPQGTGFLYAGERVSLQPLVYGGTGSASRSSLMPETLPDRCESGTRNLPGLAGLHAALEFLLETGVATIHRHERQLVEQLLAGLAGIPGVSVYGPPAGTDRGAVVSFTMAGRDPAEIGFLLDRQARIAVRAGLHCAPDAHRCIGTYPGGTVRISPGLFTTHHDIERLLQALSGL